MQYIIAPIGEEKAKFNLKVAYLAEQILLKWPHAEINVNEDDAMASWRILIGEYLLIGEFWGDKKMVILDAGQEHVADFAVWYRNVIPSNQKLWVFDDLGNYEPYEITLNTSQNEIAQALT